MPIHEWSRVPAGIFHDFHHAWITHLRDLLNDGLLPARYYALAEQVSNTGGPDVLTLDDGGQPGTGRESGELSPDRGGAVATLTSAPPQVALVEELSVPSLLYHIAVRHVSDDRVVAMIEIVSPGNKAAQYPFERFLAKTAGWLTSGYHVMVIDIHPRTPRDPDGIHVALWGELGTRSQQASDSKPLTLASYRAGEPPLAFVEPIAVGDALATMPLFLDGEDYIPAPLEASYQAAFRGTPRRWQAELGA